MSRSGLPFPLLLTLAACAVPIEGAETGANSAMVGTAAEAGTDGVDATGGGPGESSDGPAGGSEDSTDDADADDTAGASDTGPGDTGPREPDPRDNDCGDGVLDPDEVCDDGEDNGAWGMCAQDCLGAARYCGDGIVDPEEACDNGTNSNAYGGCANGCQSLGPYCGDGERDFSESCDDGNGAINDGCNPDCTDPGETLWTQSWTSVENPGVGVSTWPAGIEFLANGDVQLAVTELDTQETIWNLRIDPATGDVASADQFSPDGGISYRAHGTAPFDDGIVIVGRLGGVGGNPWVQQSVILYTNGSGGLQTTVMQLNDAPWEMVIADPDSNAIGVSRMTDAGDWTGRRYSGAVQLSEHALQNLEVPPPIAYSGGEMHVAAYQHAGSGVIFDLVLGDDGSFVQAGAWDPPAGTTAASVRGLVPLGGASRVLLGDYTSQGQTRSMVANLDAAGQTPVWAAYDPSGTSSSIDACETPLGNIIVLGTLGTNTRLRKFTANGAELWTRVVFDGVTNREWISCDDVGGAVLTGTDGDQAWFGRIAP